MQYNGIQYNTIQYNTIQCNTIQYNTTIYNVLSLKGAELPVHNCIYVEFNKRVAKMKLLKLSI